MKALAQTAKTLSDPTRIRVLLALRDGELCVCELCDALDVTQSTLSSHLQVIRKSGLVKTRREGKWMYYAMADSAQGLLTSIWAHFAASLAKDSKLRADNLRLKKRLADRREGVCCRGFGNSCN